jgi:hypothetical protein
VDDEPIILSTANRHGVQDADILHALAHTTHTVVQDDDMTVFVGPDRQGVLIEVGVVEWYGVLAVPHAMRPARDNYLVR